MDDYERLLQECIKFAEEGGALGLAERLRELHEELRAQVRQTMPAQE